MQEAGSKRQEARGKRQQRVMILEVDPGQADEEVELDFELDYLASLTMAERFELMFRRSREIQEMLQRYGHRKPVEIVERP